MRYPMKNHFLVFKRKKDGVVEVVNERWEQSWEMDIDTARFLKSLDGRTNPYHISMDMSTEEVDELMDVIAEEGLLDEGGRITKLGMGSVLICLWKPHVTKKIQIVASIWNKLLMVLWLPVFLIGVLIFLSGNWDEPSAILEIIYGFLLSVVGLFFHECSHASACVHFHGHFFEAGIMSHKFMPGAYVVITYDNVRNPFKRAQISAAGIESNLLLAGCCLCLLKVGLFNSTTLLVGAFLNIILAVFNCSLIEPLDGMEIFQELLGGDKFVEKAKKLVWDSKAKEILKHRGINGKATIVACYIILMLQVLFPIVLITNVVSIVSCFM